MSSNKPKTKRIGKHHFRLIGKDTLYFKGEHIVSFAPLPKNKMTQNRLIIPTFNHDGKYYTSAFHLPSSPIEKDHLILEQHQKRTAQSLLQLSEMFPNPEAGTNTVEYAGVTMKIIRIILNLNFTLIISRNRNIKLLSINSVSIISQIWRRNSQNKSKQSIQPARKGSLKSYQSLLKQPALPKGYSLDFNQLFSSSISTINEDSHRLLPKIIHLIILFYLQSTIYYQSLSKYLFFSDRSIHDHWSKQTRNLSFIKQQSFNNMPGYHLIQTKAETELFLYKKEGNATIQVTVNPNEEKTYILIPKRYRSYQRLFTGINGWVKVMMLLLI